MKAPPLGSLPRAQEEEAGEEEGEGEGEEEGESSLRSGSSIFLREPPLRPRGRMLGVLCCVHAGCEN